ncbi:MAG: hypothetical protein GEU76_03875 [Alphaproteobacteria bacterium]|nr:hypothetical protein [Alphaproteobacteria bacterium]
MNNVIPFPRRDVPDAPQALEENDDPWMKAHEVLARERAKFGLLPKFQYAAKPYAGISATEARKVIWNAVPNFGPDEMALAVAFKEYERVRKAWDAANREAHARAGYVRQGSGWGWPMAEGAADDG